MSYDDKIFTEIKNVFLNKFNDCCILYQKTTLKIGFDRGEDARWFEKNIIRRKKDSSVISKASLNPLKRIITDYKFEYSFKVKDKDKLIKLLNER
ncbi:hypothetical protein [Methanobacterium oryzae]|uniref:hypothetical protein n=1 Tax=Methanobacterium oryzae TaxID=69540 RepID=UPI003D228B87